MPQDTVTTAEAAQMLNCSPRTIRYMIDRGTLTATLEKVDPTVERGVYKIPKDQIEKLIKLQKQSSS